MELKKWAPWNWFKKEEQDSGAAVPVTRDRKDQRMHPAYDPFLQLHQDFDRMLDTMMRGFGSGMQQEFRALSADVFKPTLDIAESDREYRISVEIPGVDQKDIALEVVRNTLTIRGEKKQEKKTSEGGYHAIERSYGSFKRVLDLPGDADQDAISAGFKNGVLTITIPRKEGARSGVKRIDVKPAA